MQVPASRACHAASDVGAFTSLSGGSNILSPFTEKHSNSYANLSAFHLTCQVFLEAL